MLKKYAGLLIPLLAVCSTSVFAATFILPDAKNDIGSVIIGINSTWSGNVIDNDEHGDSVEFKKLVGVYGRLDSVNSSGAYTYTVNTGIDLAPGEVVQDVFPYTFRNTTGQSDDAKLIIDISLDQSRPEAVNDQFSLAQNTTSLVTGNVTGNDRGGDSVLLTGSLVGEYGFLIVDSGGGFTYTLDENAPKVLALAAREVVTEVFNYEYRNIFNGLSDTAQLTIQIIGNPLDADGNTIFEQPEGDPLDNVDIEFNDRSKDATPLNSGRNIKGHLHNSRDKDWYLIPRTGDEIVSLEVCPQGSSCFGKKSWVLYVFDKDLLTEEMEERIYTFKRWIDETGSTFDEAGDSIINGISSAGSSNHMYLAYNKGFFDEALIGIVDPCFGSSNTVDIGVNSAKTGSALLVAISSPLARDGDDGCGSGSVVIEEPGAKALGNELDLTKEKDDEDNTVIVTNKIPKTYETTEEFIAIFPNSDDQYTITVTGTGDDPLSSEDAKARSATFSIDSGELKIPRVRAYGEVFEATLNQQNKQARSTNEEALKFVLSELGELSIDEVVDAYRATFNEEKQQVVIPRVTVSETDEAFSVILQYYPAENGNDAWFEVADFKLIE